MNEPTTEISREELMKVWAPLVDVSIALGEIMPSGNGPVREYFQCMDDKVSRALEPLATWIDKMDGVSSEDFS